MKNETDVDLLDAVDAVDALTKCKQYIEKYQHIWVGTGFAGKYLVISADDLWGHTFHDDIEDTQRCVDRYKSKTMHSLVYRIGHNKYE